MSKENDTLPLLLLKGNKSLRQFQKQKRESKLNEIEKLLEKK